MKILGIIAEYNPFHLGHRYHLNKAKQLIHPDLTIVVMSGNITQRGEFTIVDKLTRAKQAINEGIDLVIELPFCYTNQCADIFAKRSIDILAALNVTDIVFGSECNNLMLLQQVAELPIIADHLKESLQTGASYAASLTYGSSSFASNDILGIAYLKALKNYPTIKAHTIARTNDYHATQLESISSAKAIRTQFFNGADIGHQTPLANQINAFHPNTWNDYFPILKQTLIALPGNYLRNIHLVSEGIEMHLRKCILESTDFNQFIHQATTKRYTTSRIQRTLVNILIGLTKDTMQSINSTIVHPLAFNNHGKAYLNNAKFDSNIAMVNRINQLPTQIKASWINAERIYYLYHHSVNPLTQQGPIYIDTTKKDT